MDVNNVTQFYHLLARYNLVDDIPSGRKLMQCMDEYSYNCNCDRQSQKTAIYNRCNAIYEEIVGGLNRASIAIIFQRIPDVSVTFNKENKQYIRTISR